MSRRPVRAFAALAASFLLLTACGDNGKGSDGGGDLFGSGTAETTPSKTVTSEATATLAPPASTPVPGVLATRNTTRVLARGPVQTAAEVAEIAWPGRLAATRPPAVVLIPDGDWRAAVTAAQLSAPPLRAPVLIGPATGNQLAAATQTALDRLGPTGKVAGLGGTEVIRLVTTGKVGSRRVRDVPADDPFTLARAVDGLYTRVAGKPSKRVVVTGSESPAIAIAAAAWAAKSGDPVLFTRPGSLPKATRAAIQAHGKPRIYVLGGEDVVGQDVLGQLRELGEVTRIDANGPVETSIAFARFSDGDMGWGVTDPGHGFVLARHDTPLEAALTAPLSASGSYGPLLAVSDGKALSSAIREYLLDVQPGYEDDPVRGVYNRAWILGDETAISADQQAAVDDLLEIQPVEGP